MSRLSVVKQTLLTALLIISVAYSCTETSAPTPQKQKPEDVHLGEMMGQLHYYTVKLGLAVQHRNEPLAMFYMNEVNETFEDIKSKEIVQGTLKISDMFNELLSTSKDSLEMAIAKRDTANLERRYHALITSCNNCHRETNHAFIVIEEPHVEYNGQNFGVLMSPYSE